MAFHDTARGILEVSVATVPPTKTRMSVLDVCHITYDPAAVPITLTVQNLVTSFADTTAFATEADAVTFIDNVLLQKNKLSTGSNV